VQIRVAPAAKLLSIHRELCRHRQPGQVRAATALHTATCTHTPCSSSPALQSHGQWQTQSRACQWSAAAAGAKQQQATGLKAPVTGHQESQCRQITSSASCSTAYNDLAMWAHHVAGRHRHIPCQPVLRSVRPHCTRWQCQHRSCQVSGQPGALRSTQCPCSASAWPGGPWEKERGYKNE
jgi:hypothetical protein